MPTPPSSTAKAAPLVGAPQTAEHRRLDEHARRVHDWRRWGPYVADRAWGTVREDYSAGGDAWAYFPHDHARSRAYRWNEDGLAALCDRFQHVCLGLVLWNERDPILKERLFGLGGPEGNHGEDVKELYFHVDGTPTHSYMRMLYKYPQVEFPYARLVEAGRGGRLDPEVELVDVLREVFATGRYFDVTVEHAKAGAEDLLFRVTVENCGPEPAPLVVLPQLWFRNTWTWDGAAERPEVALVDAARGVARTVHAELGERFLYVDGEAAPRWMFTDNETNLRRLYGVPDERPAKDAFHEALIHGRAEALRSDMRGTQAAAVHRATIAPGERWIVRARYRSAPRVDDALGDFDAVVEQRRREADEFYAAVHPRDADDDRRRVQRRAFAGLLWSKQFYQYDVERWVEGDRAQPAPPAVRRSGRNADWAHLHANDILSMPDKWEYPWFAAWDSAFHAVPLALVDPDFAKRQIVLLLREWYMHPNGALPAYEWGFGDVNPPVHAWAAWQVYKISAQVQGRPDVDFLERVFQKLLLNFTWWVNRKDRHGNNAFQGGFLGLDNIGVFDRSSPLPGDAHLEQADGTAWMAMYCLNMLGMAIELARKHPPYEDIATKFFEHFVWIANAFYDMGGRGVSLWDEQDGFYYDLLHTDDDRFIPMRIRSIVGLLPLLAVGGLPPIVLDRLPHFRRRAEWFLEHRPKWIERIGALEARGPSGHYQLAIADKSKLERLLSRMFDPDEFLSDYGLRSLSRHHATHPFELRAGASVWRIGYEPGESQTGLFGGNSNWRGPIWMPINYLMLQALRKYQLGYGDELTVEVPKGSGRRLTLAQAADDLRDRLLRIFLRDSRTGRRPCFGEDRLLQEDARFRDHVLFHEYFDGDSGKGLGASHQTGWTALVARLLSGHDEVGMDR